MERQKRWQLFLIIAVIFLTVYNILPTIFYYSKPLEKPIEQTQAKAIGVDALERVSSLESSSCQWVQAYAHLVGVKPVSIQILESTPEFIEVAFKSSEDADKFKQYFSRAGALIPFVPAQLALAQIDEKESGKVITLQRNISASSKDFTYDNFLKFSEKFASDGSLSPFYQEIINDRLIQLGVALGGISENAELLGEALHHSGEQADPYLMAICQNIGEYQKTFGENSSVSQRALHSLTQGNFANKKQTLEQLISALDAFKDRVRLKKIELQDASKAAENSTSLEKSETADQLALLEQKETQITAVTALIKKYNTHDVKPTHPWSFQEVLSKVNTENETSLEILLGQQNPVIKSFSLNIHDLSIQFNLHDDIAKFKQIFETDKSKNFQRDQLEQILYNEIARVSRETQEDIKPYKGSFQILLSSLENSSSFLAFDLKVLAQKQSEHLIELIKEHWNPTHHDLVASNFPIWSWEEYAALPSNEKKLGLLVFSPLISNEGAFQGLKSNSIYVVAKGLSSILNKYEESKKSASYEELSKDLNKLGTLLKGHGFNGFAGNIYPLSVNFSKDFIFELDDFYATTLAATRENFEVHGTKKYATLDFTNVKQRIHTINQIDNRIHEDLLKWRDDYQSAQVNPNLHARYEVPKPTTSPFVSNFLLSLKKYFRGDDRKILNWGLDLSGGKTVQIELRDKNNKKVTNPIDLQQGINELYSRVNKMGVSEVSIRQEGSNITLDFPGAQGLSAAELVKASSMYFHIVNEEFNTDHPDIGPAVNKFLQDVWNEAVVTNKKDVDSINRIAWKHLYGESLSPEAASPRSEAAKMLFKKGLRLPLPQEGTMSQIFDNQLSKIAILRGKNFSDWFGQTHPLMIVFNNYALEGSNLTNVHSSYDPTKGNFLSFEVKSSQVAKDGSKSTPRADLYAWTSRYCKEKVAGSSLEKSSRGKGWRMAVILNGTIISAPALESAIKDSAMITGSFTQREVNKLEADLKAGSLTFSPYILSEKNVSPELGLKERTQGITATVVALVLVVIAMIAYYRFAGIVASAALMINLLIMWATLQNIQATMTLAGIAGIILAIGMSVDANVLVFERVREEFKISKRIATALNAGYKKAFTAILDSNLTTIIAAVILLNFDSGPIKGFALTIIIGTISSMFTSLFLTRFFFAGWVQNPQNKTLTMSTLIHSSNFNFLKFGKLAVIASIVLVVTGVAGGLSSKKTILGMDFTGGFSLSFELQPQNGMNYRESVENALKSKGLTQQEFQVRELSPSNQLRVFLTKNLDQQGKPFYGLPIETDYDVQYSYENNPRILWIVQTLKDKNLQLTQASLEQLSSQWTSVSGQISKTMQNNAYFGLGLALLCILLYITFRFEFKYAIAATIGLLHDVLITVGTICILHMVGVPIQIELVTIAALMAIIGYSLNDTIIIFDRIREDLKLHKKLDFKDVCNQALNVTLSRTIMTSGTTILVLLALVCLGGSTIFGFALVMTIGILYGTLSSLFIAAPLLYFLEQKFSKKVHVVIQAP